MQLWLAVAVATTLRTAGLAPPPLRSTSLAQPGATSLAQRSTTPEYEAGGGFLRQLARLLTCATLEESCISQCGVTQLWNAIPHFKGARANCVTAVQNNPLLKQVLLHFVSGASGPALCDAELDRWAFHLTPEGQRKFSSGLECVEHVRTYEFSSLCVIPGGVPTAAPTTLPPVPVQSPTTPPLPSRMMPTTPCPEAPDSAVADAIASVDRIQAHDNTEVASGVAPAEAAPAAPADPVVLGQATPLREMSQLLFG